MPTIEIFVRGKVQGVFYRASAKEKALELGLKGWVKNTPDGEVHLIVSGDQQSLDALLAWCRLGPKNARVSNVESNPHDDEPFDGFQILKE